MTILRPQNQILESEIIRDVPIFGRLAIDETIIGNWSFPSLTLREILVAPTPTIDTAVIYAFDDQGFTTLRYEIDGEGAQITRDNIAICKNLEGVAITKGQLVYLSGGVGVSGTAEVKLAKADSIDTMPAFGVVVDASIAKNGFGRILFTGKLCDADTSGVAEGSMLYVSEITAGAFTDVKPSLPNVIQKIGVTISSNLNNGCLFFMPVGSTISYDGRYLKLDGETNDVVNGAFNLTTSETITASNFISTVAIGTSPYACTSTTLNTNLNADLADGYHFDQAVLTTSTPQFANLIITSGGDIRPSANSTTALNIAQADGTDFVIFDTTNKRVGINGTPTCTLESTAPDAAALIGWLKGSSAAGKITLQLSHTSAANTANQVELGFQVNSSTTPRYTFGVVTNLSDTTDATRTGMVQFQLPSSGTYATRMTILGSNVGIGTTAPSSTLEVNGNIEITAGSDIRPTADSTTAINIAQADGTDFVIFDTTNKRMGIGVAPTQTLQVSTSTNLISAFKATASGGSSYTAIIEGLCGDTSTNSLGISIDKDATSGHALRIRETDDGTWLGANAVELFEVTYDGKVGIGTTSPTYDLSFSGQAARTIWLERHTTIDTAGSALTIDAGSPKSGSTNKGGGILNLRSGLGTGTAGGSIRMWVSPTGSSGTSDNAYIMGMTITQYGLVGLFTLTTDSLLYSLTFPGTAAKSIGMLRHTTADTAGNTLTIQAGGATSGATDKNGGILTLSGGISTGAATSNIVFMTAAAGGSGTTDRTPAERIRITGGGRLGIGTNAPSGLLDVNSDVIRLRTAKTPASAGAAGNAGDICWDASYIYVCVATNSWTRAAIAAW